MHARDTHTRIRITDTFCVDGMQSKFGMRVATLFQRLYRPRSSFHGVPATLCGPIVCIIRNRLAIRAAAPHTCKEHAHVYHTRTLSSRRPISMARLHWLHHRQTAWRLSYGNSHLQGARPFGPQAHSELVTTRWYGSPMFVSSVIGSASLLMVVACSKSQQLIWYSQCICIAAAA